MPGPLAGIVLYKVFHVGKHINLTLGKHGLGRSVGFHHMRLGTTSRGRHYFRANLLKHWRYQRWFK